MTPKQQLKTLQGVEANARKQLDAKLNKFDMDSTDYRTIFILIKRYSEALAKTGRFIEIAKSINIEVTAGS